MLKWPSGLGGAEIAAAAYNRFKKPDKPTLGREPIGARTNLIFGIISTVSMAASAYHGYKRNESIPWALWWGFMGAVFPVITPVIGVAQGFGKRAR